MLVIYIISPLKVSYRNACTFSGCSNFASGAWRGCERRVPVLLREAPDELQNAAVRHQVQGTLALMVGIVDVGPFLSQKASDGGTHADLVISQQARRVQLWMREEDHEEGEKHSLVLFFVMKLVFISCCFIFFFTLFVRCMIQMKFRE